MFYEYALDPAVLSTWSNARYFLDSFSLGKGRFIANYPKSWKRMIYDGLNCRDLEKKIIEEKLARIDRRVLTERKGAPYDPQKTWLENAIQEDCREPFQAVISNGENSNSNFLDASLLDETHPRWRVDSGKILARDSKEIVQAVGFLLRISSHVLLIDPYFRPHHHGKANMLAALASCAPPSCSIEVHLRLGETTDPDYDWFASQCRELLSCRIAAGKSLKIQAWSQRQGGPRLHNRYLLTNISGVKFGDEIAEGCAGEDDHISIIDEPSRMRLWEQFSGQEVPFDRIGEPVCIS